MIMKLSGIISSLSALGFLAVALAENAAGDQWAATRDLSFAGMLVAIGLWVARGLLPAQERRLAAKDVQHREEREADQAAHRKHVAELAARLDSRDAIIEEKNDLIRSLLESRNGDGQSNT